MNELGRNILNKLGEILSYSKSNEKKLMTLNSQHQELYNMIKGLHNMNIKSQIPFLSPRQLTCLYERGWTVDELSSLSGYSVEDIEKKIKIQLYRREIQK